MNSKIYSFHSNFQTRMEEMTLLIRNLERDNKSLADKEKKSADVLDTMKAENSALNAGVNRGQQQVYILCKLFESIALKEISVHIFR
jgi:hypothetical protein